MAMRMRDGQGCPGRHQVARGGQADGQGEGHAERRGDHRNLKRLQKVAQQQLPALEIGRNHAPQEFRAILKTDHETIPGDVQGPEREHAIADHGEPPKARKPVGLEGSSGVDRAHDNQSSPP